MGDLIDRIVTITGLSIQQQRLIVRVAWVVFVSFHIAWVCGWLSIFQLTAPFADAQSSKEVIREVREERLERLEHDILQVRGLQCHAPSPDARTQYTERLSDLISKYRALSGQYPRVPACDEV